jgi:hypothetical protein
MSNLVKFAGAGLPSVETVKSLSTTLKSLDAGGAGLEGVAILKMDKTGHWVFGADQTEVESDSTWAVNPFSFLHGYIAWGEGVPLGESMVPVSEPLPEVGAAPAGSQRGWEKQIGFALQCLSGADEGLECRYTVTSVGGKKAVQELAIAIAHQVDKDQSKPVPVVRLKKDHYQHKSYGRIFTPVFEVTGWMSLDGPDAEPEATPPPANTGRHRRA